MLITINCLDGTCMTADVDVNDSVLELREKIYIKTAIPPERQRLIYCGRNLDDAHKIIDYNIQDKTSLHLVQFEEVKYWNNKITKETKLLQDENDKLKQTILGLENVVTKLKCASTITENNNQEFHSELVEKLTTEKNQLLTTSLQLRNKLKNSEETNDELIIKLESNSNKEKLSLTNHNETINKYQQQNNQLIIDKQMLLEQVDKCTNKIGKAIMEKQDLINQTNHVMKQQQKMLNEKEELLQVVDKLREKQVVRKKKKKFPKFIGRYVHNGKLA
jgi:hypothetical protein